MSIIRLGNTGIESEQCGFGALPIQRIPKSDAVAILRRAFEGGVTYYDTARAYTDSEEKLGEAFRGMRGGIYIATKTAAKNAEGFWSDLETSLRTLETDYIDVYQFHNPDFCPRPGGEDGLYDAALKAKAQGKIRHIGITAHSLKVAVEAVESGLYETLQFPFSYLASPKELEVYEAAVKAGMGFVAMKGLFGGLITNSAAAAAFMRSFPGVMPIWGVQRMYELEEFLSYIGNPPELTDELKAVIEHDKKELSGDFCRGCGYCMPCPMGIQINTAARASLLMRRAPIETILGENGRSIMEKVPSCINCRQCVSRCPYGLDTPALLKKNYEDYREVLAGKAI
ncbi:MAG: aldo/keto reductase [Oscillospiraceae bacterium]